MNAVDQYIAGFPVNIQQLLKEMRKLILETAPDAVESISYGMPAYKLNGKPLVYFEGYKNHIGFYATPSGHSEFAKELAGYKQGKGSVQFPVSSPLPVHLIRRIVEFRIAENKAP
ncbi:iron chaperone [Maribellus sediminis]|uniref:iron chaperone n=1 Tax=Maribellus sediminis TaxID=2696285 RepID=UPI001431C3C4|nr:DUF1801 domain-containing protein [Maribellus sediminis]